ncbi:hypothetical protein GCM10010140_40450 [Streptosporangium pseudovulgare]|uniref:Uncharacterized protein n=2 Tax=Streptosporangium pseudovulgare TaxID=35765 RepID=A0ABQ2QZV8_9ACTN|nr:hypothetical protein GCM10010140_40450 [Streptosporangium pseudovulgare]
MTTPVKCTECDGRGWKIVTRRGCVAASALQMEPSAREDCLYCDGPSHVVEMFEWEAFVTADSTEGLGPCGSSSSQAAAMDALRLALRKAGMPSAAWGRITHRVYDFCTMPDDWSRRVIFRATLDAAGSVRFERTAS